MENIMWLEEIESEWYKFIETCVIIKKSYVKENIVTEGVP